MSVTTPISNVEAEAAGDALGAVDGAIDGAVDGAIDAATDGAADAAADGAAGVGVAEPLQADATIASVAASRPSRLLRVNMNSSLRELNLERRVVARSPGAAGRAPLAHRTERPNTGQEPSLRDSCQGEE
jgi:hypothetical protein